MPKESGLYKIRNKKNGMFYIGRSVDIEKRWFRHKHELTRNIHHCLYLQRAWNKYGPASFEFIIVKVGLSLDQAKLLEDKYLRRCKSYLYNTSWVAGGGDLISYHPNKEEIKKRMVQNLKDRYKKLSSDERKKIYGHKGSSNGMFGKTHDSKTRLVLSKKAKAYFKEFESYRKGKTFEEVHGDILAKKLKESLSEHAKKRTGDKNPFFGRVHSKETVTKISKKKKGQLPVNCRSVVVEGLEYLSVTEASRQLNVVPATIIYRIKSENDKYKNYFYKDQWK